MTPDQSPSYPRTPAYGEGYRTGGEGPRPGVAVDASASTAPRPFVPPRGVGLALGLSVAVNLLLGVGVLALHWPPGNVFLLLWCENVVLGLVTLVRIGTAEPSSASSLRSALFFCTHYGLICVVLLGFTIFVARRFGAELSWAYLGLPVGLIVLRYVVELVVTWFGPAGLRRRTSPRQAMSAPYPRMIGLQVAVMAGFALLLTDTLSVLPSWLGRPEVLAVVVLVLLKTVVDLGTARRALRIP